MICGCGWPEMLRIHRRLGGSRLSPIVFKHYLRKLAAPYLNWQRQRMFNQFAPVEGLRKSRE